MYVFSTALSALTRRSLGAALLAGFSLLFLNTSSVAQGDDEQPDAVAIFNKAQDLHEKGDLAGAIKLYDKAIKAEPAFPEAEYQRGIAELALGNSGEAEKSFRRAVELRADWTLAMAGLGSLLVQEDQPAEAGRLLSKVIELEPQHPTALAALTELRIKAKAAPNVLQELLTKVTALTTKANPTVDLWTARAALENALGQRNTAKTSLSNALSIDPKNRAALFLRADIAIFDGDIARAKDILARLDTATTVSDSLKLLKANIFAAEGKSDEALEQLNLINPKNSAAADLRNRITAEHSTNPADLEKQLAINTKDPLILGRLCALYRRDDPAKALDYCRRAAEAEPNNVNHAVGFGAALVQAKQFDAAVNILRKIIEIVPDNSTAHANLATALFQLKRYPDAKAEFQWLTNAQPKSAGAYLFLGIVHDKLAEYLDAMANYQQYLRLADPVESKLDIDKVNLRLPALQKLIKAGKK